MLFLFVSTQLHVLVQQFNVVVLIVQVLCHFYVIVYIVELLPIMNIHEVLVARSNQLMLLYLKICITCLKW